MNLDLRELRTELYFPGRDLRDHGQPILNLQFLDLSMTELGAVLHETHPRGMHSRTWPRP